MKKIVEMVKMFILSMVVAVMMIPAMTCRAQDVWIYTVNHNYLGKIDFYIMTETIEIDNERDQIIVKTKDIHNKDNRIDYTRWFFHKNYNGYEYGTDRMGGYISVYDEDSKCALKILNYCRKYLGI